MERILKLSPSSLEDYRQLLAGAPWMNADKMVKRIKGLAPWTPQATYGSAIHAVIEQGHKKFYDQQRKAYVIRDRDMPEPVVCSYEEIEPAVALRARHPNMVHEVWHDWSFDHEGDVVKMKMRLDGLEGVWIHDHKTARQFSYDKYAESIQWKIYLYALGAEAFRYNLFLVKEPKRGPRSMTYRPLTFYPYDGIFDEVFALVSGYKTFVEIMGLESYVYREKMLF